VNNLITGLSFVVICEKLPPYKLGHRMMDTPHRLALCTIFQIGIGFKDQVSNVSYLWRKETLGRSV
jgi:hypothetical protein